MCARLKSRVRRGAGQDGTLHWRSVGVELSSRCRVGHTLAAVHLSDRAARRTSYRNLAVWMAYGVLAGPVGAALVFGARATIAQLNGAVAAVARALPPQIAMPLAALLGAILVFALIYRWVPEAAGEGIPSYLAAMRAESRFPWHVTVLKYLAAVVTLGLYGNGGIVGPTGRVSAGVMSLLAVGRRDPALRSERRHVAALCGMAAAVGAVFHAPIGGGIFAVEIIQRANMRYRDLFPAVIASSVAVMVSDAAGWPAIIRLGDGRPGVLEALADSGAVAGAWLASGVTLLLFALVVALLSGLFVQGYAGAVRLFRRGHGAVAIKVAVGTSTGALIVAMVSPDLGGLAAEATNALAHGILPASAGWFSLPLVWLALAMMGARAAAAYLTVGSGMNAGLVGPAIQVGMIAAIGAAAALGESLGNAILPALLVIGFSGMLAGTMNVPIAAAILGIEIFGHTFGVAAAVASVIAFQLNRGTMIYDVWLTASDDDREADGRERDDRHSAERDETGLEPAKRDER